MKGKLPPHRCNGEPMSGGKFEHTLTEWQVMTHSADYPQEQRWCTTCGQRFQRYAQGEANEQQQCGSVA